ncbi:hypothetical protein GCM10022245_09340 [Streptomyces mayteni]
MTAPDSIMMLAADGSTPVYQSPSSCRLVGALLLSFLPPLPPDVPPPVAEPKPMSSSSSCWPPELLPPLPPLSPDDEPPRPLLQPLSTSAAATATTGRVRRMALRMNFPSGRFDERS